MPPPELLITRVRGEYREMPGLRLTFAQACRLWQMDPANCELVLRTLVEEQFLTRTQKGVFVASPMTCQSSEEMYLNGRNASRNVEVASDDTTGPAARVLDGLNSGGCVNDNCC